MDNQALVAALQGPLCRTPGHIVAAVRPPLYIDVDERTIARDVGATFISLKQVIFDGANAEGMRAPILFSEPVTDPVVLQRCAHWVDHRLERLPGGDEIVALGGVTLFHNLVTDAAAERRLDLMALLRPHKDRLRLLVMVPGVLINDRLLFMDTFAPFSSEGVIWVGGDLGRTGKRI